MIIIPIIAVIAALVGVFLVHQVQFRAYFRRPPTDGRIVTVAGRRMFARVVGSGPVIVVDTALGSPSAEWWALQDRLAEHFTVVTYDRAGYGWSDASPAPRTPAQIARELSGLLDALGLQPPYVLLGHSQGGLNLRQFAELFPERVAGLVLLDPLSPLDNTFKTRLTPEQFTGSGVDKTVSLKSLRPLAATGIMRLLKPLLLKSPPFYYYAGVSAAAREAVWQHLNRPGLVAVVLDEYAQAHDPGITAKLAAPGRFPAVPLYVLFHERAVLVAETMQYGGLPEADAQTVDTVWEEIVREYLTLTPDARWISAKGGHFIHMSDPEAVITALTDVTNVPPTRAAPR